MELKKRIPEPELMNDIDQVEAYASADFSRADQKFAEFIQSDWGSNKLSSIIDLGCGPGNISHLLAKKFNSAQVLGIDGAEEMLKIARKRMQEDELENLKYRKELIPLKSAEKFDIVCSNSLLHHLHKPMDFWSSIERALDLNGKFYVGDLYRPKSTEEAVKMKEMYAGDDPEVLQIDFYNSLLAAFTKEEIEDQLSHFNFDYSITIESDRHILIKGSFNPS